MCILLILSEFSFYRMGNKNKRKKMNNKTPQSTNAAHKSLRQVRFQLSSPCKASFQALSVNTFR